MWYWYSWFTATLSDLKFSYSYRGGVNFGYSLQPYLELYLQAATTTPKIGEDTMIDIGNILGDGVGSAAGWLVSALVGVGFAAQKLMKNWNETSAGNMLIVNLREEVDRLSKQNSVIAELLQTHQLNLIKLQKTAAAREMRIDVLEREVEQLRRLIPDNHPELP